MQIFSSILLVCFLVSFYCISSSRILTIQGKIRFMKKNIYSQPQHSVTLLYTQSLFLNFFFDTQLLRECKDVLLGGVLVKDYYLDLVGGISNSEDLNKENTESDIEGFEQDLQSLLLVIFGYYLISA